MSKLENLKPGSWVWCINEKEKDYDGYLFMAVCGDYVIVCSEYMHLEGDFPAQLMEMAQESMDEYGVELRMYDKDNVFLTREEAQRAVGSEEL